MADQSPLRKSAYNGSTKDERYHLVVGIDFGTTYSGVSFAKSKFDDIGNINSLNKWPSFGAPVTQEKVPSQIAYDTRNVATGLIERAWGYQIRPSVSRYAWMKLHLDRNAAKSDYDDPELYDEMDQGGELGLPAGRTAQDVTADYLKELYTYLMNTLGERFGTELLEMTAIKFWFTMPAVWSDEAQHKTLEAATKAKIGTRGKDEICMIREPEAAALATLKRTIVDWDTRLEVVKQVDPTLVIDEVCVGIGAKCGATYIDRNFHRLMSKRFGDAFNSITEKTAIGSEFMDDFEWNKKIFGSKGLELAPMHLFMDAPESEFYRADRGEVILMDYDMEEIFEPIIEIIIKLIRQQIGSSKTRDISITNLVLVGGLGDSPYLQQRLGNWCRSRRPQPITLRALSNNWNAVAKGAVLRGLEQASVSMRLCQQHYGITCAIPWVKGENEPSFYDKFDRIWYSSGHMSWLVNKNQQISENTFQSEPFARVLSAGRNSFDIYVYSCRSDQAPGRRDNPRTFIPSTPFISRKLDLLLTSLANKTRREKDWKMY
ncbi:hypothetical protein G7Y89_g12042 [Cudoniella acicularis]|uniref:Actin-like ATPase domain-containing protein n=1 Tax=Cudoniella acicularis TaxID=354080 RepID=A0A8H4R9S1_9HELO|nr:hypothetical protein G7Y89_g12042 [Cudoniella acicularis]